VAFHRGNLGAFGTNVVADTNGYVPEAGDSPWQFAIDHGQRTHDDDGNLTAYGEWWENIGFPLWLDGATAATTRSIEALTEWFDQGERIVREQARQGVKDHVVDNQLIRDAADNVRANMLAVERRDASE
jgi:hypothetical protein